MLKDTNKNHPNKVSMSVNLGWRTCLVFSGVILICSLLGGCSSFSAATRNNSGTSTACVDRDLSNGDDCIPVLIPVASPE